MLLQGVNYHLCKTKGNIEKGNKKNAPFIKRKNQYLNSTKSKHLKLQKNTKYSQNHKNKS